MADEAISTSEDIMIEVLKTALPDVRTIETAQNKTDDIIETLKKMIGSAPFVLIEHGSADSVKKNEAGKTIVVQNTFNLFIAAKSFRGMKDAQRGSYSMIETIRRTLDGNAFANDDVPPKRTGKFGYAGHALFAELIGGTVYLSVFTEKASVV